MPQSDTTAPGGEADEPPYEAPVESPYSSLLFCNISTMVFFRLFSVCARLHPGFRMHAKVVSQQWRSACVHARYVINCMPHRCTHEMLN